MDRKTILQMNYLKNDLLRLITQFPKPFILLGDFNCHNPLWNSNKIDAEGKIVEKIVELPKFTHSF